MPSHGNDAARNHAAGAVRRPAVLFGSAAEAEAALAFAGGNGVLLLSHPGAAAFPGPRVVAAMVAAAAARHPDRPHDAALDCGAAPGFALDALRAGWRLIILDPRCPAFPAIADAAAERDASVLPTAPPALDLSRLDLRKRGARALLARHLGAGGTVTAAPTPAIPRPSPRDAPGEPVMNVTPKVKEILSWYESDNPGTKTNIARILNQGRLGGTGRLVILPVDQGFEHGPARSFAPNPAAYDPRYHFELAIEAGLSAYAAPLGMIEAGASEYAGQIPTILKVNSSNSLSTTKDQGVTAGVDDALRLGCSAIGFTIYPGSEYQFEMMEELRELTAEAKAAGLAVVVWSYPRGPMLDKVGETALDICAYAAHMAALIGAHIIKVKPPTEAIFLDAAKKTYEKAPVPDITTLAGRIKHVVQACFNGRRIVVFSGGESGTAQAMTDMARGIHHGGGNGSIIGRNTFQRPKAEALSLLSDIVETYKAEANASPL